MYHLFAGQFDLVKMTYKFWIKSFMHILYTEKHTESSSNLSWKGMMEMITPSMPESGDGCLVDGVLTVEFCA
jgi:hypothetical protein